MSGKSSANKFSSIVKLRKKDMQNCERKIMQNENKIASKKTQINELQEEFANLTMPQSGSFDLYRVFEEAKRMLLVRLDILKEELEALEIIKITLQEQYKQCHIEYEKVRFLEKKAQDELIKKLKNREAKEIDEIALMLFVNANEAAKKSYQMGGN